MPRILVPVTGGNNDDAILRLLDPFDGKTRVELAAATGLSLEETNIVLARLTARRLAHLQGGYWYRRPVVVHPF
jgi:hypothetical protein